jgi:hypothetical protein
VLSAEKEKREAFLTLDADLSILDWGGEMGRVER